MDGLGALLLLALTAVMAVMIAEGINDTTIVVFAPLASMIGVSWYFYSRRSKPLTLIEKVAANSWLFIRRLVGFIGALVFVAIAVFVFLPASDLTWQSRLGAVLFFLILSAFSLWVAIYGQGNNRYQFKDDIELHRHNKRRYKWRW
jgi:hypothetical protein